MLHLRILTAVVAVPILIFLVYEGGGWSLAGVLVGAVLGSIELFGLLHAAGYRPLTPVGMVVAIGFVLDTAFPFAGLLQACIAIAGVSAAIWLMRRPDGTGAVVDWALTFLPALYVGGLLRFLIPLRELPDGLFWGLMVLLGTWCCDTVAYFVGRTIGRTKLAPRISPGKSIEGAIGGIAASAAATVTAALMFGFPPLRLAGLGLTIGICAVLGDLVESFVKRQLGAKDSGSLVPGHGGVLDRIDGLLVAAAGAYFYVVATT